MCTHNNLIKGYESFEDFLELFLNHFVKSGDLNVHFHNIAIDYLF